jgi:hypothetical protein
MTTQTKKGERGGMCNRTACINGNATYFNRSTEKYYCEECGITVNTSLPKINEACLVKLVTDNKKRRSLLNLPPLGALGMPTDLPDEIIIFGNLSPFDGKWEVAYFKINPEFQIVTHWKSCNPKRVELIKEYIDKFEKNNEKL